MSREKIVETPIEIPLGNGGVTRINPDDWPIVAAHRWHRHSEGYAVTMVGRAMVLMHRLLIRPPADALVDHRDGDRLNNRRENLRATTQQVNQINRKRLNKNNTSGVRGVSWNRPLGKWEAWIIVNHKKIHLGVHTDIGAAADMRRAAETNYWSESAPTTEARC